MAKLAFIGLGQMGRYMAINMAAKSKDDLVAIDKAIDTCKLLQQEGINTASDIAVAKDADYIFLCLPNSQAVEAVILGENGLLQYLKSGQTVVDFSTITYSLTLQLHEALAQKGINFLDAPISGMEARAKDGTLTVMCGGDVTVFEKIQPYFAMIGTNIQYMGEKGAGQLTKLINQVLFDINAAALAEILPMSVKMGLNPAQVGSVVNSGTGRSYASEFFIPRILENNFSEGYSLQNAYKDLISAAELSAAQCIPLPVLHAATCTYQTALLQGLGAENKGAMIKVYEKLLGVSYRQEG